VKQTLRGIVRQRNHRPRQSAPVTPDICAAAAVKAHPDDAALLALLHDAGLRVSEAAALEWPDVECDADGQAGTVTVRSGKTGARIVAVSARAVRALNAIRPAKPRGSVFGVSESQLRRRVKSAAKAVGAEGVTSHGGRVGMAQTMARNGAAAPAIMRQGGWQSSAMVARYTRKMAAKEVVRFLQRLLRNLLALLPNSESLPSPAPTETLRSTSQPFPGRQLHVPTRSGIRPS